MLIARTDARGAHGGSLDAAIRRTNVDLEAGADMAFVEGPTSADEVRRVYKEVHGPICYNQTGVSPRFSLAEMNELGIAVTILAGASADRWTAPLCVPLKECPGAVSVRTPGSTFYRSAPGPSPKSEGTNVWGSAGSVRSACCRGVSWTSGGGSTRARDQAIWETQYL